ncbi:tetratricopeptide repeat protein [Roseibacterium sp. SDUM158017]|uniref:tetratricopeptide repeat protein n=1 Tax=Roseicyclus salinarum TaxID=3036773 RepID=UPI002414DE93|nr:tetratricopeptide repeat protein [Roseibacterium sp. SDUM158017]MDG4650560.1 tetratricopeptide repeat protein [Roseibacterium sp. SDUM158017]
MSRSGRILPLMVSAVLILSVPALVPMSARAQEPVAGAEDLDRLRLDEAEARRVAQAAWQAADAADAARQTAEAEAARLAAEAETARQAAHEAIAALSAAIAARQAAEENGGMAALAVAQAEDAAEPPSPNAEEAERVAAEEEAARLTAEEAERLAAEEEAARLAAEEAARVAAEEEAARLAAEEAARVAAEEEAARLAAEEAARVAAQEAARVAAEEAARVAEEEAARLAAEEAARVAAEEAARVAAEEAARVAAEEEAARLAAEEAARVAAEEEAARLAAEEARLAAEAALERCVAIAGAPTAEVPISEEAQRAAFRALAEARDDCTAAERDLPDAGAALYHVATIAQATGEHRQAIRLYERAAAAGVAPALTRLGDYYNFGIRPVREDVGRAVELYEEAVLAGDPAAAATLGMMHRLGRGVPRDPGRMISLMRQAADEGYHFAQYRLAQTYLSGEGVADDALGDLGLPDARAAVPLLAGAARAGNTEAAMELAELYAEGAPGLPPNAAARYRWVDFLATRGDARALALKAFLIEQGIGTARDPQRAAETYVRALETGEVDPTAMRGTLNGAVPRWDPETALAFQRILQERGLYQGALDAQVGPMTLGAAQRLAE